MNILPKKRWHVRTKDNIARVRRDEALAAEEEKKKQLRIEIAEREARTEALRKKARQQYNQSTEVETPPKSPRTDSDSTKHVNLFYELEQNEVVSNKTNEDHERELKLEKEKYEKQIGYLTYLGQDTNELTGHVSWYNKTREEIRDGKEEVSKKQKFFEDPLQDIRKYLGCDSIQKVKEDIKVETVKTETKEPYSALIANKRSRSESEKSERHSKKHKKEKKRKKHKKRKKKKGKYSSESSNSETDSESESETFKEQSKVNIEALRAERLKRERRERERAQEVLDRINGVTVKKKEPSPEIVQKYSSQFNPHLAKQNYVNK